VVATGRGEGRAGREPGGYYPTGPPLGIAVLGLPRSALAHSVRFHWQIRALGYVSAPARSDAINTASRPLNPPTKFLENFAGSDSGQRTLTNSFLWIFRILREQIFDKNPATLSPLELCPAHRQSLAGGGGSDFQAALIGRFISALLLDPRRAPQQQCSVACLMLSPLTKLETARLLIAEKIQELAETTSIHEAKRIQQWARMLKAAAKEHGDCEEIVGLAAELQMRSEIRLGQFLSMMPKNRGTRGQLQGDIPVGGSAPRPPTDDTPTYKELGITKTQAFRWIQFSRLSKKEQEARIAAKFVYKDRDRQSGTGRRTKSRFASHHVLDQPADMPPINHPALTEKRTFYPSTVIRDLDAYPHKLLKQGQNDPKVGGMVLKGKWKGFPIYTGTLEERATCPTNCEHWRSCYGNKMNQSHRLAHGPKLEARLVEELRELARKHPEGFVVRLHVLGDFYSVPYVQLWGKMLGQIPQLHIFGYTARHDPEIGGALRKLVKKHWPRFAIRFSNADDWRNVPATITIEHPYGKPADATIICPEQVGRTESCSTCALCWATTKRIAFLHH
jgi:hypothetical protein